MRLWRLALALVALLPVGGAWAGYAQVRPPAGWTSTGSGSGLQGWLNVPAANAAVMNGRAVANVTTTVAGRAVVMPASMRLAANAADVALKGLRLNPATMVAGVAVSFAAEYGLSYALEHGWLKSVEWTRVMPCYRASYLSAVSECQGTAAAAVSALAELASTQLDIDTSSVKTDYRFVVGSAPGELAVNAGAYGSMQQFSRDSAWSSGCGKWVYATGVGCAVPAWSDEFGPTLVNVWVARYPDAEGTEFRQRPAVEEDFFAPIGDPVPDELPQVLPVPLPVELPVINPSPAPVPLPQRWRVPVGEPIPVPDTDPAEYRQPVVDIVPAPTPAEPWRVDLRPLDITGTDPDGLQEPGTPDTGSGAGTPREEQQQLCDVYPDAAACKPLGEAEPAQGLQTIELEADMSERAAFGPDTAACPAPRVMHTALAGDLEFSFDGMCQFADGIRPVVVGLAYVGAVLAFFGFGFGFGRD